MVDAVVIGSGPNGLVAANLLADRGWRVTVLEAASEPGGAVRSTVFRGRPDFVRDPFSGFHPGAVASPVLNSLDLGSHGRAGTMVRSRCASGPGRVLCGAVA